MDILLTNDDGIESPGIQVLAERLRSRYGEIHRFYVVAPVSNRSGVSQGLGILYGGAKLSRRGEGNWACSGNPADCVLVGVLGGLEGDFKPGLVISGINSGENLGTDIIYSGTAAGARQGSLMGIPSIALSLAGSAPFHWEMAARWGGDHLEELIRMWGDDTFINVNIPNDPAGPSGSRITWPGVKAYRDKLVPAGEEDGIRYFFEPGISDAPAEAGSDSDAVSRNLVSISPVFTHPVVRKDICETAPDYAAVGRRPRKAGV
jgi:5'-nucleotidase